MAGHGVCSYSGRMVVLHVRGTPCPRGRWDVRGRVRWVGMWWVGLPWPQRVWRAMAQRDGRWMGTPGCGCIVWARVVVVEVRRWARPPRVGSSLGYFFRRLAGRVFRVLGRRK